MSEGTMYDRMIVTIGIYSLHSYDMLTGRNSA